MKSLRGIDLKPNPVKRALKAGQTQVGTWLSLGSVVAARFLARTGVPWLTVDMEHTHTDIQTAALMFGAIADAGCGPLARGPAGRPPPPRLAVHHEPPPHRDPARRSDVRRDRRGRRRAAGPRADRPPRLHQDGPR